MQDNNMNPNPSAMPQQPSQNPSAMPGGGKKSNAGLIIAIVAGVFILICAAGVGAFIGLKSTVSQLDSGIIKDAEDTKKKTEDTKKDIEDKTSGNVAADDSAYFIKIDGKKFTNQSKLSDLEAVGYKTNEKLADEDVPAGKYMIMMGGGSLTNTANNTSFSITPYNDGAETVKFPSAKLGQVTIEKDTFHEEKNEIFNTFEFYGGIKLGASEETLKKTFGEPTSSREAKDYKDNPYTVYEYEDKTWKEFEFTVMDGKVTKIKWTNYGKINH